MERIEISCSPRSTISHISFPITQVYVQSLKKGLRPMCWMISKQRLRSLRKRFGGNAITWNVLLSLPLTLPLCLLIYQKWQQDRNSKYPGLFVQTNDNISLVVLSNLKLTKVSDEPNHQTIDYEEFYCLHDIFSDQRSPRDYILAVWKSEHWKTRKSRVLKWLLVQ